MSNKPLSNKPLNIERYFYALKGENGKYYTHHGEWSDFLAEAMLFRDLEHWVAQKGDKVVRIKATLEEEE